MSTNGYNSCLVFVASFLSLSHWLPTHLYTLPYTLATPYNATHTNPLVNTLATIIWGCRYALVRCCKTGHVVVYRPYPNNNGNSYGNSFVNAYSNPKSSTSDL